MVVQKTLIWTKRSFSDLQKIFNFNTKIFGINYSKKVIEGIILKAEVLEKPTFDYTKIGEVDNDFKYLKREYRKLIEGHCKISYRIGNSKIYIVRVFDTRQNPNKNK